MPTGLLTKHSYRPGTSPLNHASIDMETEAQLYSLDTRHPILLMMSWIRHVSSEVRTTTTKRGFEVNLAQTQTFTCSQMTLESSFLFWRMAQMKSACNGCRVIGDTSCKELECVISIQIEYPLSRCTGIRIKAGVGMSKGARQAWRAPYISIGIQFNSTVIWLSSLQLAG